MVILAKSIVQVYVFVTMKIKTTRIPKILQVRTETFSKDPFGILDMLAKVNSSWYPRMKDILTCPRGWMWLGKPGRGLIPDLVLGGVNWEQCV